MKSINGYIIKTQYPVLNKKRPVDAHKGVFGTLGIIGGSYGMSGAIVLSGSAALKVGCGKVILGFNQSTIPLVFIESIPELIFKKIDDLIDDLFITVLVIGPGLGNKNTSFLLPKTIFSFTKKIIILDADALNILSLTKDVVLKKNFIITPHPKEAARLLKTTVSKIQFDRKKAVLMLSEKYSCWVVLKGYRTLIASPNGETWCNYSGNVCLATSGTGDVLSGIIGGLLAQQLPIQEAVCGGVWLHGAAADKSVASGIGPIGLIAHEIIDFIRIIRNELIN
ncbi:unnamed protein product [Candidatus Providencia siddallii]|uniref:ADP-dependent (S)-NAD(P)H-hydrate dehydratase n=1 Tax=Candidatus Providencia siddallii TaxID=1715285 RepID=A0A0M6W7D8_9GAMM|nr:unnamed protein product [Candidatus Providencia siddallii]